MFTKIASVFVLSIGLLSAGLGFSEEKPSQPNCCKAKLACCAKDKACCAAPTKLGCCAKGMKCCDKDAACCAAVQECCKAGAACCDEVKACCGPVAKKEAKGCCTGGEKK
jgi:hypothetical protein